MQIAAKEAPFRGAAALVIFAFDDERVRSSTLHPKQVFGGFSGIWRDSQGVRSGLFWMEFGAKPFLKVRRQHLPLIWLPPQNFVRMV
jgi:hypothetical protein